MLGYDVEAYKRRVESFGWKAHLIDGHNFSEILKVFDTVSEAKEKPQMIIAKTIKGKGVSFLEDKEGWHGKALKEEQYKEAIGELGEIDFKIRGEIGKPDELKFSIKSNSKYSSGPSISLRINRVEKLPSYKVGEEVATRKAYGQALVELGKIDERIVSLDAEVKNSTYAEMFKDKYPERFFEMFIAEQNMVGAALGLSKRGKIPFVSTFGVFLTRAFDQIRMASYSKANVKFMGSHSGVSIGEDGPSQMALQDIAMFRTIEGSTILYPADGVSAFRLTQLAAENGGIFYIRCNRPASPVIYGSDEVFEIGGSKVVRSGKDDRLTVVAAGITLIEAIRAADFHFSFSVEDQI
jgi:transketolase